MMPMPCLVTWGIEGVFMSPWVGEGEKCHCERQVRQMFKLFYLKASLKINIHVFNVLGHDFCHFGESELS